MKSPVLFLLVVLSVRNLPVLSAVPGNLALYKPSLQSGTYSPKYPSSNAVNGDTSNPGTPLIAVTSLRQLRDAFWRVDLLDYYVIQTVEFVSRRDGHLHKTGVLEVRVGASTENNGILNPPCGERFDLSGKTGHIFRCELYGRYVYVRKANTPARWPLAILEIIVNQEPTTNIALGKPTVCSSSQSTSVGCAKAVDGKPQYHGFVTNYGDGPHWWMVDFEATKPVVKIFAVVHPSKAMRKYMTKIIITIGDSSVENGKTNPRFGKIYDLSRVTTVSLYSEPPLSGRYAYVESLTAGIVRIFELEFYSESRPYIAERSNGVGRHSMKVYRDRPTVLPCEAYGNPKPYVAWLTDGVILQNRTTDTDLLLTTNLTTGSTKKYECHATNIHGKDYYDVTVKIAGYYQMCLRPLEIKDSTRSRFTKLNGNVAPSANISTFNKSRVYTFFNPEGRTYMKLTTSCPPSSSCNTEAPGWLVGTHPKPEDGFVRRKICFHYAGDCCYESRYIYVMNCPGVFVYELLNTKEFPFNARYCFENDASDEAFAQFVSLPISFGTVGGTNTALANHIIASYDGINDSSECILVCMMRKCWSFNYAQSAKICQVNDVTKSDFPIDLTTKNGFRYYHPMKQPIIR